MTTPTTPIDSLLRRCRDLLNQFDAGGHHVNVWLRAHADCDYAASGPNAPAIAGALNDIKRYLDQIDADMDSMREAKQASPTDGLWLQQAGRAQRPVEPTNEQVNHFATAFQEHALIHGRSGYMQSIHAGLRAVFALKPKAIICEGMQTAAALRTLEGLGYTFEGGELWKPPVGPNGLLWLEIHDALNEADPDWLKGEQGKSAIEMAAWSIRNMAGEIRFLKDHSTAWQAVADTLSEVRPGWQRMRDATGITLACDTIRALAAGKQMDGMPSSQEPKYGIRDNRLYNRASGEFIPVDEPVFIFRARDNVAAEAIDGYAMLLPTGQHREAVHARVIDFDNFAKSHPDRMKAPDTDIEGQRYAELERIHLGDPDKGTGIYAGQAIGRGLRAEASNADIEEASFAILMPGETLVTETGCTITNNSSRPSKQSVKPGYKIVPAPKQSITIDRTGDAIHIEAAGPVDLAKLRDLIWEPRDVVKGGAQ